jgi:hypothetical protein
MQLEVNEILTEFEEMIDIAEYIIANRQEKGLNMSDFLQLCVDIRNGERGDIDLSGKNIVIPDVGVLQ